MVTVATSMVMESQDGTSTSNDGKWLTPEFDLRAKELMGKYKVPGLSIAVIDGNNLEAKGYGIANGIGGDGEKVTPETLFWVGSTTKSFTAAAMALLVDDNENYPQVQWETPISELIGDDFVLSDSRWTPIITIKDALTHRTGMDSHDMAYGLDINTPRDIVRSMRYLPFTYEPRTNYVYNNYMYITISHVIETLTGKNLGEFLKEKIWHPLGMDSTYWSLEDAKESGKPLSRGYNYVKADDKYVSLDYMDMRGVSGAGCIISSVLDYAKYLKMMLNKAKPLSKEAHEALTSGHIVIPGSSSLPLYNTVYGFGWGNVIFRNTPLINHNGGLIGYGSSMNFLPELDKAIVIFGNTADSSNKLESVLRNELLDRFLKISPESKIDWDANTWKDHMAYEDSKNECLNRERLFPKDTTSKLPLPVPLEKYTGKFHHPAYQGVDITIQEDRLWADWNRTWPGSLTFDHVTGNHFFVRVNHDQAQDVWSFTKAEFFLRSDGKVGSFDITLRANAAKPTVIRFERVGE